LAATGPLEFRIMRFSRLLLLFILATALYSCQQPSPEACISNNKRTSSFFVGEKVKFAASCSQNAQEFIWKVGQAGEYKLMTGNSFEFAFEKPGLYEIQLRAIADNQSATSSMLVEVKTLAAE
jgi:hypothetical protein